jgi:predicted ATPase
MSFKLLAIRPLEGCNKKFLKNLEENRIYKFYNDYEFILDKNQKEVIEIKHTPTVPENFYGDDNIKINVSAIVGKNGSGKSSLVELLYAGLYNLSVIEKILVKKIDEIDKSVDYSNIKHEIDNTLKKLMRDKKKLQNNELKNLFDKLNTFNNSIIFKNQIPVKLPIDREYDKLLELSKKSYFVTDDDLIDLDNILNSLLIDDYISEDLRYEINEFVNSLNIIAKDVKLKMFFETTENDVYSLEINSLEVNFKLFKKNKLKKIFKNPQILTQREKSNLLKVDFFYSLAVNYSFYALNSIDLGRWLKNIFHKNDSYQMPIVLNPMRTDGSINVNTETSLTKSRFLFNLYHPLLVDNQQEPKDINGKKPLKFKLKLYQKKIVPTIMKDKFNAISFAQLDRYSGYINIINNVFGINIKYDDKSTIQKVCYEYIFSKIYKTVDYYKSYDRKTYLLVFKGNEDRLFKKLLLKIRDEDNSHITLKMKQVVNFLKYYDKLMPELKKIDFIKDEFEINVKDYSNRLKKYVIECNTGNYSQFLIPSFFDYDLIFEDGSSFSQLSSGEKQLIYGTNTILYHLLNVVSVHENNDSNLKKYKYINMVYDEIELYYHPELQREFLNYLLNEIRKQNLEKIGGLNILLITHSPFILSDIPKQNVLFLKTEEREIVNENGKTEKKTLSIPQEYKGDNTFGENIHQMLTDGFFISNTKGEFALSKINEFLEFYRDNIKLKEEPENFENTLKNHEKLIDLIGEDYVRAILRNHLDELKVHFSDKTYIDLEEERLKNRLIEIEKIRNAKN